MSTYPFPGPTRSSKNTKNITNSIFITTQIKTNLFLASLFFSLEEVSFDPLVPQEKSSILQKP